MSTILVIEDDPAILRGLADNLRFESYSVLTATSGEAGLATAGQHKPDLLILDLMLPGLSSYEVGPEEIAVVTVKRCCLRTSATFLS